MNPEKPAVTSSSGGGEAADTDKKQTKLHVCSLCKRKFLSEKLSTLHYAHSKMHKDNVKLFGIF